MKIISVGCALLVLGGATAAASKNDFRTEAATSTMLKALSSHSQKMLASVIAPGAVYFSNEDTEEKRQSTPLLLESMSEIRGRCEVEFVFALCPADTVMVVWNCPSERTSLKQTYTRVNFNQHGRITSVVGDGPPLACVTGPGPRGPKSN